MFLKDFLRARHDNTLDANVSWRAYDFEGAAKAHHALRALKVLGFKYAGELALPHFMAQYSIATRAEAQAILGQWWLLREVEAGGKPRGLHLRTAKAS